MVVATALLFTGVLGSAMHWDAGGASHPVLALARDMPAGGVFELDDGIVMHVHLDPSTTDELARPDTRERLVGQTLTELGHAYALRLRAQV